MSNLICQLHAQTGNQMSQLLFLSSATYSFATGQGSAVYCL